jgi:hypothetical protein
VCGASWFKPALSCNLHRWRLFMQDSKKDDEKIIKLWKKLSEKIRNKDKINDTND